MPRAAAVQLLVASSALMLAMGGMARTPQEVADIAFASTVTVIVYDGAGSVFASGSGFVLTPGHVVTNAHVVEGASSVAVRRIDASEELPAVHIEAADDLIDLALLHVPALDAPPLSLAGDVPPAVGDTVYAVGSPLGFEGTFSPGIVSGLRYLGDTFFLQVTAPVSAGSSGGPLLDAQGRVLGVIVGTFAAGQNLNFAVPAVELRAWSSPPPASPPRDPLARSSTAPEPPLDGRAREVVVEPRIAIAPRTPIPIPAPDATVVRPAPAPTEPAGDEGGDATTATVPLRPDDTSDAAASAMSPVDGDQPTGSSAPPHTPFQQTLARPLAVVVDNVRGYPQHGLTPASQIHELPVEGGLTRLLLVFDRTDPEQVGPVRSARDYMVELSRSMGAVMVHDGGSPGALAAITATNAATLDSYGRGQLFRRADGSAPYNLFADGDALRAAVDRLGSARQQTASGVIFRPDAASEDVNEVRVRYGGTYETAFRYEPGVNAYRWLRNGAAASDAADQAILLDAVLVASIDARPIPGDAEGRLYLPLRGGRATLFLRGKAVTGEWSLRSGRGVRFATKDGDVDLTPFKLWVAYTPTYDRMLTE